MNFFWQGTEAKKFVTLTITHTTRMDLIITLCSLAYPSAEDLVDGRRLLERALGLNDGPHLLHVEHERVQRLLDVRLLVVVRRGRRRDRVMLLRGAVLLRLIRLFLFETAVVR